MVRPDYLLERMLSRLDQIVTATPAIADLLDWVLRKQKKFKRTCKPAAIRSFYFEVGQLRALEQSLERAIQYGLESPSDLTTRLDYKGAVEFIHGLDFSKIPTSIDSTFTTGPGSGDLASEMHTLIGTLFRMVALNDTVLQKLDYAMLSQGMAKSGRPDQTHTSLKRFGIGKDFTLSESDLKRLKEYRFGNEVLITCLKTERVSTSTRAKIEEALFLPSKRIARYFSLG
jgi:hypothetical protein